MKQSESVPSHKHVAKPHKEVKDLKAAKENVKSQKNVVKVASVCKKVERDHKKKTHVSQHDKQDMLSKPKKLHEGKQNLKDVANVGIRDKRISDYKIPLTQRSNNFCRPSNRYRKDDDYYDRCIGLGRGYRSEDV